MVCVVISEHHFLVTIPRHKKDDVLISEHLIWDETTEKRELSLALGQENHKLRVILSRLKWEVIADEVRTYFNQRLRDNGLKSGQWKLGDNPVSGDIPQTTSVEMPLFTLESPKIMV